MPDLWRVSMLGFLIFMNGCGKPVRNLNTGSSATSIPSISYSGSIYALSGNAITTRTPANTGDTIDSYSISPDLTTNSGLNFDTTTCAISGTPTTVSAATYTVTAANSAGSSSTTISIETNFSGVQMWLRSDSGITQDTTSGSTTVGTWADLTGNNNGVSQTTKSKQPIYVSSAINGYPVVRFDGSATYLENTVFSFTSWSNAFSVFVVASQNSGGSDLFRGIVSNRNPLVNPTSWWTLGTPDATTSATHNLEVEGRNSGSTTDYVSSFSPAGQGSLVLALIKSTSASILRKNGVQLASSGSNLGGGSNSYLSLGKWYTTSQIWNGDIVEVLLYNSALSSIEYAKVESYLNSRYSVY